MYIPKTERTICYLIKDSEIFLGIKLRGFGKGKLNGYGGKLDAGETPEIAAIRELKEEAGVSANAKDLDKRAVIDFYFPFNTDFNQKVHVYFLKKWNGIPIKTEEMSPVTYSINNIPYDKMWDSDKLWLPLLFEGKLIEAMFVWKKDNETIENYSLKEIDKFL